MIESNVVPFLRCKCGAAAKRVELCLRDEPLAQFNSCQACLDETNDTLDRVRPVFEAMIAAGIDRETANETMTYLLDLVEAKR
jgi:hypothetical protein